MWKTCRGESTPIQRNTQRMRFYARQIYRSILKQGGREGKFLDIGPGEAAITQQKRGRGFSCGPKKMRRKQYGREQKGKGRRKRR